MPTRGFRRALDVAVRLLAMFAVLSSGARAAAQTSAAAAPGSAGNAEVRDEGIPIRSELVRAKCASCHSMARVLAERRTKEEWELLVAMHRGYYPLVDNQPMNGGQGFRRTRPTQTEPGPDGRPPDNRHPMDKALEHLTKTLPLTTSEWATWSAAMQSPKLAGRWAIVGSAVGKGAVYGTVVIAADPGAPDTFTTDTRYTVARTGETVTRTGKAIVYTGYQWRGRGGDAQPWRGVLFGERDWRSMWGRGCDGSCDEAGSAVSRVGRG